jgi:hypothetical protein
MGVALSANGLSKQQHAPAFAVTATHDELHNVTQHQTAGQK